MRWPSYLKLYDGLNIPVEEAKVRPGNLGELSQVNVAPEFAQYSKEELAITHGYLVSRMSR